MFYWHAVTSNGIIGFIEILKLDLREVLKFFRHINITFWCTVRKVRNRFIQEMPGVIIIQVLKYQSY